MPRKLVSTAAAVALLAGAAGLSATDGQAAHHKKADSATAQMHDRDGNSVGTVKLTRTPHGTLLHARLAFMPPGAHAFHVHGVGTCEPPFKSAGGHYNPEGSGHGLSDDDGMHVGDMPNIHVPNSGVLEIEVLNTRLDLDENLFDDDGAAIVIHDGPDDYEANPAGAAGPRIACGVIEKDS